MAGLALHVSIFFFFFFTRAKIRQIPENPPERYGDKLSQTALVSRIKTSAMMVVAINSNSLHGPNAGKTKTVIAGSGRSGPVWGGPVCSNVIHPVVDHCGSAALQSDTHPLAYAVVGCDESNAVGGSWGFPNVNSETDRRTERRTDRQTETERRRPR